MASIFEKDPIYITVTEAKDSSSVLNALPSDGKVKEFIYKAQKIIDAYIVKYWVKTVSTQEFIFPVNGDTTIPSDIKEACVLIAEHLSKWDPFKNGVSEITEGDTSIKFDPKIVSQSLKIPLRLIGKYRRNSFKIAP